jgi:hypothetical protein
MCSEWANQHGFNVPLGGQVETGIQKNIAPHSDTGSDAQETTVAELRHEIWG